MTTDIEGIWRDFSERLGAFIRSRVRDAAAADDIRQEVFAKMQHRLGQLRDFSKVESWLHQIARNAIADHFRALRETVELPEDIKAQTPADNTRDGLQAALRRMVDALPAPYREAVTLAELDGLTQQAVAKRLGLSLSGAKSRIQRGRALLKGMLTECCRFAFDARGSAMACEPRKGIHCPECG
jgi:RNA polymerase sigma-70 factor (ECF subfamily)